MSCAIPSEEELRYIELRRAGLTSPNAVLQNEAAQGQQRLDARVAELRVALLQRQTQSATQLQGLSRDVAALNVLDPDETEAANLARTINELRTTISNLEASVSAGHLKLDEMRHAKQSLLQQLNLLKAQLKQKPKAREVGEIYKFGEQGSHAISRR